MKYEIEVNVLWIVAAAMLLVGCAMKVEYEDEDYKASVDLYSEVPDSVEDTVNN